MTEKELMQSGLPYSAVDLQLLRELNANKDIPANVVAAGNPCKVIKQLIPDENVFPAPEALAQRRRSVIPLL